MNLINHLKTEHRGHYKKFNDDRELAESQHVSKKDQELKQLTIKETKDRTQQWRIHDAWFVHVHRKL